MKVFGATFFQKGSEKFLTQTNYKSKHRLTSKSGKHYSLNKRVKYGIIITENRKEVKRKIEQEEIKNEKLKKN